jgi:hypothetical protein
MTPPAQPLGGTARARFPQIPSERGRTFQNTPTGYSTADRDGGCEGRAASEFSGVNAGRLEETHLPAKLANVAVFSLDHGIL